MWLLWVIGGWIQVASKRYFITDWSRADLIHAVVGSIICIATMWNCISLFMVYGFLPALHPIAGIFCLFFITLLFITGVTTYILTRYYKEKIWDPSEVWRKMAKLHSIIAYVTLILCALVCSGGIGTYALLFLNDDNLY